MSDAPLTLKAHLARDTFTLDVDLRLPGKGITALFGPSGSGKTTCLRILAGLEPTAHAHVVVGDETWQDSERGLFVPVHRRALGYVFQEASLFDHLTVEKNLRFGFDRTPPAQRHHPWDHALDLLGIAHLLQRRPNELSGGERQRVSIARALATSPRVLLMDEPLAALDAARKAEILPWLEQLHTALQIPVVYVTHSADELMRLADHVILLAQGQMQAQGPVQDILTRTDLPLSQGDAASTLIEARISGAAPADGLCVLDFGGAHLLLPHTQALQRPPGTPLRVRIHARDVSLALDKAAQTSVLNILPATVTGLLADDTGQVLVSLQLQGPPTPVRLLSRISQLSARKLGIAPGMQLFAQIKGVALVR